MFRFSKKQEKDRREGKGGVEELERRGLERMRRGRAPDQICPMAPSTV